MIKICQYCKTEFECSTKRKCCSQSCQTKLQWSKPGFKEKMSIINKEAQNRPEVKKKISDKHIEIENRPDVKQKKSIRMKKLWSNKDFRNKMDEYYSKNDVREFKSIIMKKICNDDKYREKMSIINKEAQNRPEVKKKKSDILKKYHNDHPEFRKKLSNNWLDLNYRNKMCLIQKRIQNSEERKNKMHKIISEYWKNIEYVEKIFNSSYRYKDYILPSGKIVKIQGYESKAINELLQIYDENDIIIGARSINKEIGRISYLLNNKEHTYIPDIYIKSINTIIEVKSNWTYYKNESINIIKKDACLNKGFNFKFMIYK